MLVTTIGLTSLSPKTWIGKHRYGENSHGPDGLRQFMQGWTGAFPYSRTEITGVYAGDDFVALAITGRGTHEGVLKAPMGSPADQPFGRSELLQGVSHPGRQDRQRPHLLRCGHHDGPTRTDARSTRDRNITSNYLWSPAERTRWPPSHVAHPPPALRTWPPPIVHIHTTPTDQEGSCTALAANPPKSS